jgi:hypothetical protein
MNIRDFHAEDAILFGQAPEAAEALSKSDLAWTGVAGGEPVACGGLLKHWPHRYMAWMLLPPQSGPHMVAVTRAVKRAMELVERPARIEMHVRQDFIPGHRFATLLGFEMESVNPKFFPDMADADTYVRFM